MKAETSPVTEGRERPRKEAATLDGEVAGCTSRELPGGPSWGPQDLSSLRGGLSSVQVVLAAFTLSRLCP